MTAPTTTAAMRNISKEVVTSLEHAPIPQPGIILQVRTGKAKQNALGEGFHSAIFKDEHHVPVFCSETGLIGDEHVFHLHGGYERAVNQYNPEHYAEWRAESPPKPELFEPGGFGENVVATNMTEDNVCIGDVFKVGEEVLLRVMEPRMPCNNLNRRFQWERVLKRTLRTGRVGWNFSVEKTGHVCKGDAISLVKRPFPQWSVLNVQRVIRGKGVALELIAECAGLPMTKQVRSLANKRLMEAPKAYRVTSTEYVTPRVKKLTFALQEPIRITVPALERYAFAQIRFGPNLSWSRSYSIVSGNVLEFSLGVALDDQSRGGSLYLHQSLQVGDIVEMSPCSSTKAVANEKMCKKSGETFEHVVIIGGVGVTAFLPLIRAWEDNGVQYRVHYAVRSLEEAAFLEQLPTTKTTVYAKSNGEHLEVDTIIPEPSAGREFSARIFACGPSRMMEACERRAAKLRYPEHLLHFESFGGASGGGLGEEFEVEVHEPDVGRREKLTVPSDKSLLDVLGAAGFDVPYSCKTGGCGACKVVVCSGEVDYSSTALTSAEKGKALQSCVDRGIGKLCIEID